MSKLHIAVLGLALAATAQSQAATAPSIEDFVRHPIRPSAT